MPKHYVILVKDRHVLSDVGLAEGEREYDFSLPIIATHPDFTASQAETLEPSNWALDTSLSGYGVTSSAFLAERYGLTRLPFIGPTTLRTDGVGEAKAGLFQIKLWIANDAVSELPYPYLLGLFQIAVQPERTRTLIGRNVLLDLGLRVCLSCAAPADVTGNSTITVEAPG